MADIKYMIRAARDCWVSGLAPVAKGLKLNSEGFRFQALSQAEKSGVKRVNHIKNLQEEAKDLGTEKNTSKLKFEELRPGLSSSSQNWKKTGAKVDQREGDRTGQWRGVGMPVLGQPVNKCMDGQNKSMTRNMHLFQCLVCRNFSSLHFFNTQ